MICIVLCLFLGQAQVSAAETDISNADWKDGRVLFISSYSYSWDTVQYQIEGIKAGLGTDVTLDYEFMDTKRAGTEDAMELFYEGFKYRLSQGEPYDVIILGDDAALQFALQYREELFPEVPIVFEGVNDLELATEAAKDPLITGIAEQVDVGPNIEWGLSLIPDATKVTIILDDSVTSDAIRKQFYEEATQHPGLEFTELNSAELSTDELITALKSVDEQTVLLYILMSRDKDGKYYTNQDAARMIKEYVKVPCICMVEGNIGKGVLGGYVVSMEEAGIMAGDAAARLLQGSRVTLSRLLMECPSKFSVDVERMKYFGLDEELIPEGAERINYQESFWEEHGSAVFPIAFVILVLLFFMVWVGKDNIRHRHLVQELEEAKRIMETASQHDFLTGLPNRSKFRQDLENLFEEKRPCTLLMIDIDDFKKINDTLGHKAGDQALQQVAERLMSIQSQILTPYRYAGDEFIIILESNLHQIIEKAGFQCRQLFAKPFELEGEKTKIYGSIGIASYPNDTDNLDQLIVNADDAMYGVKKNGKNDFAFYGEKLEKHEDKG